MTKAIIDASGYTAPELLAIANTIHDTMVTNAATFAAPPVTMAAFAADISDYEGKLNKKSSGAEADLVAFTVSRNTLEVDLGGLGNYVNTIAKGKPEILVLSGFPSYDTARTPDTTPPAAPQNLVVRQGDVSGTAVARYQPDRPHSVNEVR